jgi:methyl-accepting chemotaxis protein
MSLLGTMSIRSKITTTLAIAGALPILAASGLFMTQVKPHLAEEQRAPVSQAALLSGLAALAFSLGFANWAGRRLVRPLDSLAAAMAEGDAEHELTARADIIGDMARTIGAMSAKAGAVSSSGDADAARAELQRVRAQAESEREQIRQDYAGVVDALSEGVQRLSGGDLTYRIERQMPQQYEGLRTNFNSAVAQLQQVVRGMLDGADTIRNGASEISRASDDLSRRTEQQAASLEETAAALDEITATVQKTAAGARQASDAVTSTRSDAEKGGSVVREAVTAMSEIERSSSQVSQIIGVIDEIAFQTNLLALNAGVEAARAGDAGRGFAVVAQEVRALAQRSADAAKEIKQLISRSTEQVGAGVALVGETGEALERIFQRVAEIDGLVSEIAVSVQEQSSGLSQVNIAINQMDQATQQNAAMVEESTAATRALTQESEQLSAFAERFNAGRGAAAATRSAAKPARTPTRSAPAGAPQRSAAPTRASAPAPSRPAPQRKAAVGGKAAALLAEAPGSDDWEEF